MRAASDAFLPPPPQNSSMRGNRISTIPPGTFGYFPNLTALDLSYNNFTQIPGAGLDMLPQLRSMYSTS